MSDAADAKREAFTRKMTDILNGGALNLAMGLGYRLGLFETLDALATPARCGTIAAQAGLDARYVKEWLGVMVCGGIVELSAGKTAGTGSICPGSTPISSPAGPAVPIWASTPRRSRC